MRHDEMREVLLRCYSGRGLFELTGVGATT